MSREWYDLKCLLGGVIGVMAISLFKKSFIESPSVGHFSEGVRTHSSQRACLYEVSHPS